VAARDSNALAELGSDLEHFVVTFVTDDVRDVSPFVAQCLRIERRDTKAVLADVDDRFAVFGDEGVDELSWTGRSR
jgi:hypothetical protein